MSYADLPCYEVGRGGITRILEILPTRGRWHHSSQNQQEQRDFKANCSPFPAVSLWPPNLPSLLSDSGVAADPSAAADELSEVLGAPSHCHSPAYTLVSFIGNTLQYTKMWERASEE